MRDESTVTRLLEAARSGDRGAIDSLFPLVYDELRRRARVQKRGDAGPATLNTTAIVHEAYIKLANQSSPNWENRAHFLAVAAKAMRHVYLDYAKLKSRQKRGGDVVHTELEPERIAESIPDMTGEDAERLLALDAALEKLKEVNPRQARVVECRFFAGMTVPETAEALSISPATVKRDWTIAQITLHRALS